MVEGAKDAFLRHGGDEKNLTLVLVPGAFEIPMALEKVLASGKFDAVCCVGAVIRGATPHFDYVSAGDHQRHRKRDAKIRKTSHIWRATVDNIEQAIERAGSKAGNKGFEAMTGVIEMLNLYKKLGE